MFIYPSLAKRYLRQAHDSLEEMRNARDGDDLKRGLISFLEASKHSTIQLQSEFKSKIAGFDEWWSIESNKLKNDNLCKFFYSMRNKVVKGGENVLTLSFEIRGPSVLNGLIQISDDAVMVKQPKGDVYEWVPNKDVPGMKVLAWKFIEYPLGYSEQSASISLCESYLSTLDATVDNFIARFGQDR